MFNFTLSGFIVSMIVSSAGLVSFIYGKKMVAWKPMVGGVALMALPMLVSKTVPMAIGGGLVLLAIYIFRD